MRSELYHHGIKGQKWGKRYGPPYPLRPNALAQRVYDIAEAKEPHITSAIKEAASYAGSKMYGLDHRLKTKESIERKIRTDVIEKGISHSEASKIKDAVRYTTITDDDNFVASYTKLKAYMMTKGYTEVRCKNYFEQYRQGLVKHKSVQSVFQDSSGYQFEVQFQTPASQLAKDKKVPIYEERRQPNLSRERQLYLEDQMVQLAEAVPYPRMIKKIKSH